MGPASASWKSMIPRIALARDHEIARVIVPMDEHRRLRERLDDEELERARDRFLLVAGECEAEMLRGEPLRHQHHLAHQHFAVVRRELGGGHAGPSSGCPPARQSVAVQRIRVVAGLEAREVLRGAEVFEQQQAALGVHLVKVRNVDTRRFQEAGDLHIGPNVFLARGRVHDDEGALRRPEGAENTRK